MPEIITPETYIQIGNSDVELMEDLLPQETSFYAQKPFEDGKKEYSGDGEIELFVDDEGKE